MKYTNCCKETQILIVFCLTWFTSFSQTHHRDTNYHYSIPAQLADGIMIGNIANSSIDSFKIIELTKLILKDTFPNIHSLLIAKDNKLVYENYFSGKDENWGSG